ncbi:MAG: aminomethyl-transferring glycine dehydrogenase subunit GcvPA [Candidatus Izemoplasmatales bacterium]|jgi:glycine dehydrogenase subunit 1|nr:aminomethyl-transferring glycine dehydrogenase subunit GcvPA [Candidatus Izemoplasmatales bacterium]MDD3865412.1 aminomethyl-transferring glycine dehydrogenase subunit GcvPA [Candidatus Izemoplasmatales bacterium]
MFKYFPHTENDLFAMKAKIGIRNTADLFRDIPENVAFRRDYDIPSAMSEIELRKHLEALAAENKTPIVFSGMGAYDHYNPAIIAQLVNREEFLTAYTPYQPEVAQGTLQYIFEFQSMVAMLSGMEVANASMYDGATATAEAMFMGLAIAKRNKFLVSATVSPFVLDVIKTYAHFRGVEIVMVPMKDGVIDRDELLALIGDDIAGLIVQKPNFYGIIEDYTGIADQLHAKKAILIENNDISTLAVLKTPSDDGADIACGDCQSLGMPLAFGGPYLGYMATKKAYARKLPGRIVGQSFDKNGKRAYVLTLQAREQHIRREKANSNICSNQSLMALYATIYLALMGPDGLKEVNEMAYSGAHYLYDELLKTGKFFVAFEQPFLKEFVVKTSLPPDLIRHALDEAGMFAAVVIDETASGMQMLLNFAVTEKRTKKEIDCLVAVLGGLSC